MQPLNEDKFLCYSCNNWLINWYSVQNKSGSASGSSSNSSSGGNTATTTTTTTKDNKTKSKISQNQEADDAPMDSDSYFNGCGQTLELRKKLQKHLYVPKTVWPSDGFTVAKTIKKRKKIRRLKQYAHVKCNLCSIPLSLYSSAERRTFVERQRQQRPSNTLRFCRICKRALAKYYFSAQFDRNIVKQNELSRSIDAQSTSSSQIKLVNPYVLSRLKKLGTTVVRERCASTNNDNDLSAAASSTAKMTTAAAPAVISSNITTTTTTNTTTTTTNIKPSSYLLRTNTFFIDRPDEIRSPACSMYAEHLNSNSRSQRNEKNEIILAFDRTVTEVFPAAAMTKEDEEEKGCGVDGFGYNDNKEPHIIKDVKVINDIYKRIPKSLSITLLA